MTQAAEHLLGYSAGDVVGRSGALVLPSSEETPPISAFIEQCRAQSDWSGTITVRHRDGRMLDINHRISMLWGRTEHSGGLCPSPTSARSPAKRETDRCGSRFTHAPIGIVVRDQQLRCVWVNDTMERHDAISRDRRFGRRLVSSMPGSEAEALEAVMRRALRNGTTAVHEYRAWPTKDPRQEHAFSASYFCLKDADGKTLGVCGMSVDITGSQRARERLAILSQAGTRIGSTLDVMQTGQELADLAVPLLADYAYVDLGNPSRSAKSPRPESTR